MSLANRRGSWRGAVIRVAVALSLGAPSASADGVVADVHRVELPPGADKMAPLGVDGRERVEIPDEPGEVLPVVHLDALSCATPTLTGALIARHPYYDVMLGVDNGSFAARTGASHSVTALAVGFPQNVIYGGAGAAPRTSDVTWRFHDQGVSYLNPTGGAACVFNPPDSGMEPNNVGVEEEWVVTPAPGITCLLREEIVAFGSVEENSGVRLTLETTNFASSVSSVNVGVRWQIDYQNSIDDGPWLATVTCNPMRILGEWSLEHEFVPGTIRDFYRIRNNQGFPTFSNITSTTPILGIPGTFVPDRLVFGRWPRWNDSSWNVASVEGACCPDDDSSVLWYHGYLPANGDIIPPGETVRRSVVIFSSADNIDCGAFTPGCDPDIRTPPTDQKICRGQSATLDASGVTLQGCEGMIVHLWTDGPNAWLGPVINVSPTRTTTYRVLVSCSTEPACVGEVSVTVTVDEPVITNPPRDLRICTGASASLDASGITFSQCSGGVAYTWTDGVNTWPGPAIVVTPAQTTTYHVHATCAVDPLCSEDRDVTVTVGPPAIARPPTDQRICVGDSAQLDASGVTLPNCAGSEDYLWTDGVNIWRTATIMVAPPQTTVYRIVVSCAADPSCVVDLNVTVTVDEQPVFLPPIITDPDNCNPGIVLTWNPASFFGPSGSGVYNVYRSQISCAAALMRRPIATGLTTARLVDDTTFPGATYYYVVEAEDDEAGTACPPPGPFSGGSVTRICASPTTDFLEDIQPAGVGPVLRVRHAGDEITVDWSRARALLAFEHVHLMKAWVVPNGIFRRANPEGDVSLAFTETERSGNPQFFDLRVANKCEGLAAAEYPPGWDPIP